MSPAVRGLATGVLSRGMRQGVQLFEKLLDLPFGASRCLRLLLVFVTSGKDRTEDRLGFSFLIFCDIVCVCANQVPLLCRLWLVSHGMAEQSLLIFVLTGPAGDLQSGERLPQLPILLLQVAQR